MEKVDFVKLSETLEVGYDGQRMKLAEAVNEAVADMGKSCIETGKKGKIVVELELDPEGMGLQVKGKVKATPPEPNTTAVLVFSDRKGNLTFDDAEQGKLPELASVRGGEVG